MAWKKQLALPDGKVVALRDLSRKDSPKELADFINSFLKEKAYLRINRKISVAEEKAWIRSRLKGMKKGNIIHLHLECKGKLVGVVDAERGEYKHHGNVFLGITILPPFRSKPYGVHGQQKSHQALQETRLCAPPRAQELDKPLWKIP